MAFERMANNYSTQKDLVDRLHGTICRYKDLPVSVQYIDNRTLSLQDTVTGASLMKINPADPDFDISSPEVGYFNTNLSDTGENKAIYATRLPVRRFRQGLYPQCVNFEYIDGDRVREYKMGAYLNSVGFRDSVMKKFPTLTMMRALLRIQTEVAISQELAFKRIESGLVLVYFKMKNVGWIKPDSYEVEVTAGEFDWVVERYLNRLGLVIKEKVVGQAA